MGNGFGAMSGSVNGVRITTAWNGGNLPPQISVYSFAGLQGSYRVQVLPQVIVQQRPPLPAHFPNTGLYSRQVAVPQTSRQPHRVHWATDFSPYSAKNMRVAYKPHAGLMPQPQKKRAALASQNWKNPAKSLHFRKPLIVEARAPQIQKKSTNQTSQLAQQPTSRSWVKQAPFLRYRKPVIARSVRETISAQTPSKVVPPTKAVSSPKVVPSPPPPPIKTHANVIQKKQNRVHAAEISKSERTTTHSMPRKSRSSLPDVIKSKKRIIARFESERQQYSKKLAAHNHMVARAIDAFDRGDNELGNQLMIKTNQSFGVLYQATQKMMEAQREAFLASIDVDMVHAANENEPIPDTFLQFQQQVKDIGTLIANVAYYFRENMKIPVTTDSGFQKTWCRLGSNLIKVAKKLGQ